MGVQYQQRVDETHYVVKATLVPGLRGRARTFPHWPDPLVEPPLGGIKETNKGFPWIYAPQRTKSWAPGVKVLNVYHNGNKIPSYSFRAQMIKELSTRTCS